MEKHIFAKIYYLLHMNQRTIKKAVTVKGVGLHTGQEVSMSFHPAPVNHGFRFKRIDLENQPVINADVSRVVSTQRGTTLQNGDAQVNTVEHVLSALTGLHLDNILMELDGPEIPIMDGSAIEFVKVLKEAGFEEQDQERDYFVVEEPIVYRDEETGTELMALPSDNYEIITMIDFNSPVLGQQYASISDFDRYEEDIAPCRTFVFLHEVEYLFKQNLIKGGDLSNAIVIANEKVSQDRLDELAKMLEKPSVTIDQEGVLNTIRLKFKNEPARLPRTA